MVKLYLIAVYLLFCSSCSGLKQKKHHLLFNDIEVDKSSLILGLESKVKEKPRLNIVKYGHEDTFGPHVVGNQREKKGKKRGPVVGLMLGPGLHRVMAHLCLIRELNRKKIPIHVISGTGLGAVVAGLVSFDLKIDEIEWLLFNFWSKSKYTKPYTNEWYSILDNVVLKKFKNKDIQDGMQTVFFPVLGENGETHLIKTGNVRDVFSEILNNKPDTPNVFERAFYKKEYFLRHGADIIIGLNVLDSEVFFVKKSIGFKDSLRKFISYENYQIKMKEMDLFFEFLEKKEDVTDPLESIAFFEEKAKAWAKRSVKKIEGHIDKWNEPSQKISYF